MQLDRPSEVVALLYRNPHASSLLDVRPICSGKGVASSHARTLVPESSPAESVRFCSMLFGAAMVTLGMSGYWVVPMLDEPGYRVDNLRVLTPSSTSIVVYETAFEAAIAGLEMLAKKEVSRG